MRDRILMSVLLCACVGHLAFAQGAEPAHRGARATVTGVVHDSVSHAPLQGAVIQMVGSGAARTGRTAYSDSLGHFVIADVPSGRYTLGFFHPMLDSLGLEPTLHEVLVGDVDSVHADLAIPSAMRLRSAICGRQATSAENAVVVGIVRDARDGSPVANADVSGEWLEYSIGRDGVKRQVPRRTVITGASGWFALCDVPTAGTLALWAAHGGDSTDVLQVGVSSEGFLHQDLYLGESRGVAAAPPAAGDSAVVSRRQLRTGNGRITGTVVANANGRPLAGAVVDVGGSMQARTNAQGEFTLSELPTGTRVLGVRALGYYPERRTVTVRDGAAPLSIRLSTLQSVLDTVRVTATRRRDLESTGFLERMRTGAGRYLTADDILKRQPIETSDMLKYIAGIRFDRTEDGERFYMKDNFGTQCIPAVFIDGHQLNDLGADDLNSYLRPRNIAGVEVYTRTAVPVQFLQAQRIGPGAQLMPECGSIVIWTK